MDEGLDRRREAVGVGREKREEKEERRGDAIEISGWALEKRERTE
jgi:hypothetical protein